MGLCAVLLVLPLDAVDCAQASSEVATCLELCIQTRMFYSDIYLLLPSYLSF